MKQKTFIKLTAWLLAIAINGLIVVVYLNVKGLDGGFLTQIEKGDASLESGDLESALKHYLKAVSIAPCLLYTSKPLCSACPYKHCDRSSLSRPGLHACACP